MEKSNALNAEDFLASLMAYAPLGIISVNEAGIITHANRLAKVLLHVYPVNRKIIDSSFMLCIEHIPVFYNKVSSFLEMKKKSFNTGAISINERYIVVKGVSIQKGFICIINEVTKLKAIEAESIQSIIAGQENERRRIAREIHDGIGPLLSTSKLELDAFLDEHVDPNDAMAEEKLLSIRQTIDSITNDLRDLSHHLIPRLLEEFGLHSAFSNLTTKLKNSLKIKLEFYCNIGPEARFNQDLELNLFRCGQELLQNAVKHARASEILVQLIRHETSIVLMVEDDGIGFIKQDSEQVGYGIGLTNIKTRVRTFDGEFLLESHPDRGTTASIELPIKNDVI